MFRPTLILLASLATCIYVSASAPPESKYPEARESSSDFGTQLSPFPFSSLYPNAPEMFKSILKAAETQNIRITATLDRSSKMGKPIFVDLTLENGRDESVQFDHTVDESDFYLRLLSADGNEVPVSAKGDRWRSSSLYAQLSNNGMQLGKGKSISRRYDLNEYFVISKPGPYRLSVVKTVKGTDSYHMAGTELEVDIDSIIFEIR